MRHGKKGYKLGRTASHRKATLAALSNALIEHKRITTTFTKAKALRIYVEPVINRAKDDTVGNRRQAFRRLGDKRTVKVLFDEIADAIGDRPGGYTRIVKLGQRAGDGAEMAVVELVDFNDVQPEGASSGKRRRRTRRGGGGGRRRRGGGQAAETTAAAAAAEDAAEATTEEVVDTADTTEADAGDEVLESPEVVDAEEVEREAAEAAAEASEISAEESDAAEDPRGREQAPRNEI